MQRGCTDADFREAFVETSATRTEVTTGTQRERERKKRKKKRKKKKKEGNGKSVETPLHDSPTQRTGCVLLHSVFVCVASLYHFSSVARSLEYIALHTSSSSLSISARLHKR